MITVYLKDAPEKANYWRVYLGPGGNVFDTGFLRFIATHPELSQEAKMPVSELPEPYHSGSMDWFIVLFYTSADARYMLPTEGLFRDIQLNDNADYEYSYIENSLREIEKEKKRKPSLFPVGLGVSVLSAILIFGMLRRG